MTKFDLYIRMNYIHHFKKAYGSVRREVLHNILTEFGKANKKVSLNEAYSSVRVFRNLTCFLLRMV